MDLLTGYFVLVDPLQRNASPSINLNAKTKNKVLCVTFLTSTAVFFIRPILAGEKSITDPRHGYALLVHCAAFPHAGHGAIFL